MDNRLGKGGPNDREYESHVLPFSSIVRFTGLRLISDCSKRRPQGLGASLQTRAMHQELEMAPQKRRSPNALGIHKGMKIFPLITNSPNVFGNATLSARNQQSLVVEDRIDEKGRWSFFEGVFK